MSRTYISKALRQLVRDRSAGCCEYCLLPESSGLISHEVDHVIAEKHGGVTEENNLALFRVHESFKHCDDGFDGGMVDCFF
jgi:5-methylcytosine-specific restriction endonuclease McrA